MKVCFSDFFKNYKPNVELTSELENMNSESFQSFARKKLVNCAEFLELTSENEIACQTVTRQLLEKARQLEHEDLFYSELRQVEETFPNVRLYAYPKPLYHESSKTKLPLTSLPQTLSDYINAVSAFGQVPPEMCMLPLLSVLSLCVMGKAKVKQHRSSYTHELTIYSLTVAPSSARKSPALTYFSKPLYEYQKDYNQRHELERNQRATERQFYENQKKSALSGRNSNLNKAKEIDEKLLELPPIPTMSLTVTDITPESLAAAMNEHGGKMGVLDSEGGVLRTISGLYSGGQSNIDLLLKSYDGEFCEIWRATRGNISIPHPLLSIGLMTQPKRFQEFIRNIDFVESGLINRFLFSFPTAPERYTDSVPEIPVATKNAYYELIKRLLSLPESDKVIGHDRESELLFHDLHEYLQSSKQSGGIFEFVPGYAEKQLANALKIAAILHLCNSSVDTPINGQEAQAATAISMWLYNQALIAFDGNTNDNPIVQLAHKAVGKLKKAPVTGMTIRELYRETNSDKDEMTETVEMLLECNWLRDNGKRIGESGFRVTLNPLIAQLS